MEYPFRWLKNFITSIAIIITVTIIILMNISREIINWNCVPKWVPCRNQHWLSFIFQSFIESQFWDEQSNFSVHHLFSGVLNIYLTSRESKENHFKFRYIFFVDYKELWSQWRTELKIFQINLPLLTISEPNCLISIWNNHYTYHIRSKLSFQTVSNNLVVWILLLHHFRETVLHVSVTGTLSKTKSSWKHALRSDNEQLRQTKLNNRPPGDGDNNAY